MIVWFFKVSKNRQLGGDGMGPLSLPRLETCSSYITRFFAGGHDPIRFLACSETVAVVDLHGAGRMMGSVAGFLDDVCICYREYSSKKREEA